MPVKLYASSQNAGTPSQLEVLRLENARLQLSLKNAENEIKRLKSGRPTGIPVVDRAMDKINRALPKLHGTDLMASAMKLPTGKPSIPAVINQTFRRIRAPFATGLLLVASWMS
ncbi:MAG: hypothetical protein ACKV2Q_19245 [Planctomycetaceae bacterium]